MKLSLDGILQKFLSSEVSVKRKQLVNRGEYFSRNAHFKRRFSRFYKDNWFWVFGSTSVALILAISFGFQSLLSWESRSIADREITHITQATVQRIESRLNGAVSTLRNLAQDGQNSCGGTQVLAFAEAAKGLSTVVDVALVGADGYTMCTTGDRDLQASNQRQQLLPAHENGHPRVTLVQPDSEQPEIIVASWHTTDGNRLAATIDGRRLDLDSEPALFKGALYREISLSGKQVWIAKGLRLTDDEMENAIIASADGSRFPITVSSYAPEYTLNPLNFLSRLMVPVVAILFFVIIGFTLKRLNKSITSNAESSIESALDDGQIQPMFQPLIELTTGRVIGAEILMRWQKKDGTIARPGDFIHRVETAGLTRELTVSLLNSAIVELGETYRELPSMTLSINLFPSDIKSDRIVSMVQETLTDRPLRAEQIIFEVTERRGLEDLEAVQGVLAGLSKLGARVALDNAGAGHLGLSGLRQLWPDVVKIDKVLVDALDQEDNARSIIDTIVGLAAELAIGIVAEGVETIDQMTRLKAIGVTAAQGYLFSKPLPGDEFKEFLKKSLRGELSKKLEEMQAASSQKGKSAPVKAA